MSVPIQEQRGFSSILFDTLFGLVIFLGFDAFLQAKSTLEYVTFFLVTLVVVHWWLQFKAADDRFSAEVESSVVDVVFGILYLVFLELFSLFSREQTFQVATWFLVIVFGLDAIWALLWRRVGSWQTKDHTAITLMEKELDWSMLLSTIFFFVFLGLALAQNGISSVTFVTSFGIAYLVYIILTFKTKILDIRWF